MTLTFGSWCSGIEAASEAWLPLGWRCAWVAEIEPFPCAYLHQRHGAGRPRYMPKPGEADKPDERKRRATMAVRRITVVEAETLQGFPPNATLIDWPSANRKSDDLAETIAYLIGHGFTPDRAAELAQTPDGPRYKAIGNSWPVTVAAWIGQRIMLSIEGNLL